MPMHFRLPKDEAECASWKAAVASEKGVNTSAQGVPIKLKNKLKQHFSVGENELKCLKTGRKVLIASKVPDVLHQYHNETGHPSR